MTNETIPVELKSAEKKEQSALLSKMLPLSLLFFVVLIDQITKFLVIENIPVVVDRIESSYSFFGDFLRIIHVQNPGVAFSIGHTLSHQMRAVLFAVAPFLVIIWAMVVYFRNNTFTVLQRWAICGIIGGGLGNLYDRFFRVDGVVDFIDVKFYGLFGLERWPTFNIADASILICGFLLIISFLTSIKDEK